MKSVDHLTSKILKPIYKKKGFSIADLLLSWRDLVGKDYADYSLPIALKAPRSSKSKSQKQKAATLTLKLDPAFTMQFHYDWPAIRHQINQFYGYEAVNDVKVISEPFAVQENKKEKIKSKPLSQKTLEQRAPSLTKIKDESLKNALSKLAQALYK